MSSARPLQTICDLENVITTFAYLSSAELTDIGRRRANNEDSLLSLPEHGIFCVADGMGGVQGGEVASQAVVDAVRTVFLQSPEAAFAVTADASATLFELALNEASQWIKQRADRLGIDGTGSTVVGLVFDRVNPSRGIALHAGDSRAYRLRHDKLEQLTADHSAAAAAGLPDDSLLPPMFRGVITRAVGLERNVNLDATPFDVMAGDIFLLCSDGLDKMLSDRRIHKILRKHQSGPLEQVTVSLVDEALHAGGDDNVTVIIIRVDQNMPHGPTMDIPPETLVLEQLVVSEPDAYEAASWQDESDMANEIASEVREYAARAAADSAILSEFRGRVRSRPKIKRTVAASSGSGFWFWLPLILVILAGVVTFLLLKTRGAI